MEEKGNKDFSVDIWEGGDSRDERHLYTSIRYVKNNPVRAKIVKKAEDYSLPSAKGHINKGTDMILSGDCHLKERDKRLVLSSLEGKGRYSTG